MNNKIKEKQLNEVLYGLNYIGNKIKNDDGKLELGVNNCKLLLDYITNLQNQLEEKTYLYNKLDTENKYTINNLQEENEKNKKAIEYIDNLINLQEKIGGIIQPTRYSKIKNILQGESDES